MVGLAEDDPRLVFVPIEEAVIPPPGLIDHIKDRWWAHHPTKGLVFYKSGPPKSSFLSPQCNASEEIAKRLLKHMYPWAELKFVPNVFRKINPRDYV